ncbi:hypothetical protein JHK84_057290 [Glycine max]|nr:hypothetical protein JHK84_057290 [Glycine max]
MLLLASFVILLLLAYFFTYFYLVVYKLFFSLEDCHLIELPCSMSLFVCAYHTFLSDISFIGSLRDLHHDSIRLWRGSLCLGAKILHFLLLPPNYHNYHVRWYLVHTCHFIRTKRSYMLIGHLC